MSLRITLRTPLLPALALLLLLATPASAGQPLPFTKVEPGSPDATIARSVFTEEYEVITHWPEYSDDTLYHCMADLNGDGRDELLIVFAHMAFHGSAGTAVRVATRGDGGTWKRLELVLPSSECAPVLTGSVTNGYLDLLYCDHLWRFDGRKYAYAASLEVKPADMVFLPTYSKPEEAPNVAGWYLNQGDVYSTVHVTVDGNNVTVSLSGGHVGNAPQAMIAGDCEVTGVGRLSGNKLRADFPPTADGNHGGVSMTFGERQLEVLGAELTGYCGMYTRFYGVYKKHTCPELKEIFKRDLEFYAEHPDALEALCEE